tara:strand:+ start:1301 stop:1765 length:465 start_codon:yes stop_codon:yes gene_type:complete
MKKRILLIVCGTIFFFMPHLSADEHPYTKPNFAPNNPHSMWDDGRYNTRIPPEPQRRADQYYYSPPPQQEEDNYIDTATKMLLDQGILGLAVLAMGWLVFKLFNKLDAQREEGEKVLTGIVDRNYDMLNKLEGRLAELSARLQNVEREVERIRS